MHDYFFLGESFALGTAAMVFTHRSNASLSKIYKLRADFVTMVFSAQAHRVSEAFTDLGAKRSGGRFVRKRLN